MGQRLTAFKVKWKKAIIIFVALSVFVGLCAFMAMAVKDRTYVGSPEFKPTVDASKESVVIYYSRSGHSEAVAREVARKTNSHIAKISADYALDFQGQSKAISDATSEVLPPITIEPVDLLSAKRVYLISPTWMFRPAPPLWTFISQSDLDGKEIILIMTGNSRIKQEQISEFSHLINSRGGRLIHQIFLRRGRIYWQLSREELLQAVDAHLVEMGHAAKK
jgi:flavodoxin